MGFLSSLGSVLGSVATIGGALLGASAAKSAANTQANAAQSAADLQYQQWRESVDLQQPWHDAGVTALNKLIPLSDYTPFGMDQFKADPGYQFRLSEGLKALDRQAAARGGLISGAALKAAGAYGQQMASDEYTNAFNRYQTERNARLQPLQSLAGVGQTATQNLVQQGQNYAANAGNLMTSGAAARASGYVGSANAINAGLGNAVDQYNNYLWMQRFPQTTPPIIPPSQPGPWASGYRF